MAKVNNARGTVTMYAVIGGKANLSGLGFATINTVTVGDHDRHLDVTSNSPVGFSKPFRNLF